MEVVARMVTAEERLLACQALRKRELGGSPPIAETVYLAAVSLCSGEQLTADRLRRLGLMRDLFEAEPGILEFLGGSGRAATTRSRQRKLAQIDIKLQAKILSIADMVVVDAADKIDVELRQQVDRARLRPNEVNAFDLLETSRFLQVLREPARAKLTNDEESKVRKIAEASVGRIDDLLEEGSESVIYQAGELIDPVYVAETHAADRVRATAMYSTAITSMILGRLDRATDNDNRKMTEMPDTPVGVARDLLEIAGGAASTASGGLARENGTPLTINGERSKGANFAQGNTVSQSIEETQGLVATRVFRHSGAADARSEHAAADGATEDELGGAVFPGQHSDCGCSWEIEWRRP